jgi:hypothetical protein
MKFLTLLFISFIITLSQTDAKFYEFLMRGGPESESFIAETNNPEVIALVESQLALPADERSMHISGAIEAGNAGYNKNWSWHFVTEDWTLADFSIELCDGQPSMVEGDLDYWLNTVQRFCPWNSYVSREVFPQGNQGGGDKCPVKIYPNPADNYITISWEQALKGRNAHVRILSYMGREVLEKEIRASGNGTEKINISRLQRGIYHVQVKIGNSTFMKKIMVI